MNFHIWEVEKANGTKHTSRAAECNSLCEIVADVNLMVQLKEALETP